MTVLKNIKMLNKKLAMLMTVLAKIKMLNKKKFFPNYSFGKY